MATKVCFRCKKEKDINEFHKNKRNTDGHKGTCKTCCRLYVDEHIEKKRQYEKNHYEERKPKRKNYFKEYRKTDKYKESKKRSYLKNRDKWKKESPEHRRRREKGRYENDLTYNIIKKLRTRFYKAVTRNSKHSSILDLVCCSIDDLKKHIESLFQEGMTWDLLVTGKIHIDHIKPIDQFDMTDYEEQKKCFHWSNLQPLWAKDNLEKSSSYNGNHHSKK